MPPPALCQALLPGLVESPQTQRRETKREATQMLFFSADTQKALTTLEAGLAFTTTSFPNMSLLPAFVAGLFLIFNMHRPGMVNFPAPFTSLVATAARLASTFLHSAAFNPVPWASASAIPVCDMAAAPFIAAAFIAAAFIAFGAMVEGWKWSTEHSAGLSLSALEPSLHSRRLHRC